MNRKTFASCILALASVVFLVFLVLIISHTIVAERLEAHISSVPEEARLFMIEGASTIEIPEGIEYADNVTCVSKIYDEAGNEIGCVIDTVSSGSDGDVVVRVAFDDEDSIAALDVLDPAGLPTNLGYKAALPEFTDQFIGASSVTAYAGSVSGTLIKFIDDADYSCAGVYSCVTAAFTQLRELRLAEEGQAEDQQIEQTEVQSEGGTE